MRIKEPWLREKKKSSQERPRQHCHRQKKIPAAIKQHLRVCAVGNNIYKSDH